MEAVKTVSPCSLYSESEGAMERLSKASVGAVLVLKVVQTTAGVKLLEVVATQAPPEQHPERTYVATKGPVPLRVKFMHKERPFGFFHGETGRKDVFFHISAVEKSGFTAADMVDGAEFVVTYGVEADGRCSTIKFERAGA